MSIELVMPSNHLILSRPFLLLPSIFPSFRVFSSESVLPIKWPKHWSLSFSISLSNECSGLISFRNDWFDLLAVQGTNTQESSQIPQFKSINSGSTRWQRSTSGENTSFLNWVGTSLIWTGISQEIHLSAPFLGQ